MNIGIKLRTIRKNNKLTLKQLGELVGLSEQAIGQYERGDRNPSIDILNKIAAALGITVNDLLNYEPLLSGSTSYIDKDGKITEVLNQRNKYISIDIPKEYNVSYPENIEKEKLKEFDDEMGKLSAINLLTSEANIQNFTIGETKAMIDEIMKTAKNLITIAKMERGTKISTKGTSTPTKTHDDLTNDKKDFTQKRIEEFENNKDK